MRLLNKTSNNLFKLSVGIFIAAVILFFIAGLLGQMVLAVILSVIAGVSVLVAATQTHYFERLCNYLEDGGSRENRWVKVIIIAAGILAISVALYPFLI